MSARKRQLPMHARGSPEYHAREVAEAQRELGYLRKWGRPVPPADAKRCREYAVDVFGQEHFAPWLLVYTAVAGSFKEGWIPQNLFGGHVVLAVQGSAGRASSLKSLAGVFLDSPAVPDVGAKIHGRLFDRHYQPLTFAAARERFFENSDRIMFKADVSARGLGVQVLDREAFVEPLVSKLGNGVFQRRVTQHEFFTRYCAGAVATVRVTTVVEDSGEISPRSAYLKLGTGADTHVRSDADILVAVDLATGALDERGYSPDWREFRAHPTGGAAYAGLVVPLFGKCLETALSLHRRVPFVRCVGWDLAVEPDESVQVLEWNGFNNGMKFSEAVQGPCFTGLNWERFAHLPPQPMR